MPEIANAGIAMVPRTVEDLHDLVGAVGDRRQIDVEGVVE